MIVGQWKAYQKAGRKGYESLIPFHRDWVQLQLAGMEGYWVFLLYLTCIPVVGWLVDLGVRIWWDIELAKSYSQSAGFGVGLALLPCVFWPILGFGKAQYVGPADEATGVNQATAQPAQVQPTFTQSATAVMPSEAENAQQAATPQQNATFPQANTQPTMPTQSSDSTTFGGQNS